MMTEDTHPSTHPPLPPTTEDDRVSWLRLLRSRRVGPATFHRLMREHGTAQAALESLPEVARAAGMDSYKSCPVGVVEAEMRAAEAAGVSMICYGSPLYPASLHDIPDAPPVLWALGALDVLTRPMVALVGARNASSLGTRMARALARELGEAGYIVVSGLARGVDAAAHGATVKTGTVAVQAGGVDVIYPAENARLAEDILANGVRLSEQPMGLTPQARHFPPRNRIISGLASAVVVVEAAAKSGSLITARNALDQGREVLAVPGHPFDARASGCNMLIRDGAQLVRNAADVIEVLTQHQSAVMEDPAPLDISTPALEQRPRDSRSLQDTAALHREILSRLGPSPVAEDQLIRDLQRPAKSVTPILVDLELDGKIARQPGGLLAIKV